MRASKVDWVDGGFISSVCLLCYLAFIDIDNFIFSIAVFDEIFIFLKLDEFTPSFNLFIWYFLTNYIILRVYCIIDWCVKESWHHLLGGPMKQMIFPKFWGIA